MAGLNEKTRVLVTGGSGFIGTNVVEHYRALGHEVLNLDVEAPRNSAHTPTWRKVDILDADALRHEISGFDPSLVFHLAARTDLFGSSISDYPANTTGVRNMVDSVRTLRGLKLAVFASSMLVCRIGYRPKDELDYQPSTPYGESKIAGEKIVREIDPATMPWVIVRPTSIWGPWFGSPYRDFFETVRRGLYVHPAGRRIRRNYGFVLNAVAQLARLAELQGGPLLGKTIYLADYEPIELKDWADRLQKALGGRRINEVPMWVFRGAALGGDVLKKFGWNQPPMSSYRLNNMLTEMVHDTAPLQSVQPQLPYSLDEAIHITCEWIRRHPA